MTITNVLGETRPAEFEYVNGYYVCPFCHTPQRGDCGNPACTANPSMSAETARMLVERWERAAAEDRERQRIAAIRDRMAGYGR